jgi:mRNA-degrading endonuclease RelE of RelBE toxin-antitoxin system
MKVVFSERLLKSYETAPRSVQKAFDKQLRLLMGNLQHPSLRAKKYDERGGVWQARATKDWRFYFLIQGDSYCLIDLIRHPK